MNRTTQKRLSVRPQLRQRGFVLALCLVLLMIMTILGMTALNTSMSQEGMAQDIQQSIRAFQNAESGGIIAGKTLNEVMQRDQILDGDPARNPDSIPVNFPIDSLYDNFKKTVEIQIDNEVVGETEFVVRRTGNIDGPTTSCRSVESAQSGGCTRFYSYKSTGKTSDLARAEISGAGCVFTQAVADAVNAASGSRCN